MEKKYDEGLIVREYAQAKDKNKQIQILAELNGVKKEVILEILKRNGAISGIPGAKSASSKTVWSAEMDAEVSRLAKEGLKLNEIAERLGITPQAIYSRRKYLSSLPEVKAKVKTEFENGIKKVPTQKKCIDTGDVFDEIIRMLNSAGWEVQICSIDVLSKTLRIQADKKESSSCTANTRGRLK